MSMNRQQKRMLQKQGEVDADGAPVRSRRQPPASAPPQERTSPGQFLREVRGELRKVAWPTRDEVVSEPLHTRRRTRGFPRETGASAAGTRRASASS